MLVYERKDELVLVEQNNHGILSGYLFDYWNKYLIDGERVITDVHFAVRNHDRAWIDIDAIPLWNDGKHSPYSFIDFPSALKLPHYQKGIDWVEMQNKYAALLCSQHYSSFFQNATDNLERQYYRHELERQSQIRLELKGMPERQNIVHLQILKFLDNLSIYICMNEPGASKDKEFNWYKSGFPGTEELHPDNDRIAAYWLDTSKIGLTYYPFEHQFDVSVPIKTVKKKTIRQQGIATAYEMTPFTLRRVTIVPLRK